MPWPLWHRVKKTGKRTPHGALRKHKQRLREEGGRQCVYCALPDRLFGGYLQYHIEHFKPKSRFRKLARRWSNLFYACPVCNVLKADDWPSGRIDYRYVDPSRVNYCTIFRVDATSFEVEGRTPAARYKVERLHLNRLQLVLARKEESLRRRYAAVRPKCSELFKAGLGQEIVDAYDRVQTALEALHRSELYQPGDL